jgi:hypothetical protein
VLARVQTDDPGGAINPHVARQPRPASTGQAWVCGVTLTSDSSWNVQPAPMPSAGLAVSTLHRARAGSVLPARESARRAPSCRTISYLVCLRPIASPEAPPVPPATEIADVFSEYLRQESTRFEPSWSLNAAAVVDMLPVLGLHRLFR